MYSSTTYGHAGLGYSRTITSPGRTYTTTVNPVVAPITTTSYAPGFGGQTVTTTNNGPFGGSTVTRTFSPSRTYSTTFSPGRTYTTTVNPIAPVTTTHYGAPLAYNAPVTTTTTGPFGTTTYHNSIASPSRTTTSYGPFGATSRTVNYF